MKQMLCGSWGWCLRRVLLPLLASVLGAVAPAAIADALDATVSSGSLPDSVLSYPVVGAPQKGGAQPIEEAPPLDELAEAIRRHNGGTLSLETGREYVVTKALLLAELAPDGITILGNGASIRPADGSRLRYLLGLTDRIADEPYAKLQLLDISLLGNGSVWRAVLYGSGRDAVLSNVHVEGGLEYQINIGFRDSLLKNISVKHRADANNNAVDVGLLNTAVHAITVDMSGNYKHSALWQNGSDQSLVVDAQINGGKACIGAENSRNLIFLTPVCVGHFAAVTAAGNFVPGRVAGSYTENVTLIRPEIRVLAGGAGALNFNDVANVAVFGGSLEAPGPLLHLRGTRTTGSVQGVEWVGSGPAIVGLERSVDFVINP